MSSYRFGTLSIWLGEGNDLATRLACQFQCAKGGNKVEYSMFCATDHRVREHCLLTALGGLTSARLPTRYEGRTEVEVLQFRIALAATLFGSLYYSMYPTQLESTYQITQRSFSSLYEGLHYPVALEELQLMPITSTFEKKRHTCRLSRGLAAAKNL